MGKGVSFNEGIAMRGDLRVVVRSAITREVIRRIEIRNKITFLAADVLVELWAQRASDPQPFSAGPSAQTPGMVWSMRMGTSNTPASRSDTNLGAYVIGSQLLDVNKITGVPGELQFIATLGAGDANGSTLQEAGLFTRGSAVTAHPIGVDLVSDVPGTAAGTPRMIARQIHPAIPKTGAITLEYDWRVAFTA